MTEWVPATEAEQAMRDALRNGDQEMYFQILAQLDLLLPVSADALAGRAPMGWGTWTSGNRTHVLAFTSSQAMAACLAEHTGSARRIAYHDLAQTWPNHDWWLAVNPGLPIEGYLPAWFVAQLARGDVRLPGRGLGVRDRTERVEEFQRARAVASVPGRRGAAPAAPAAPAVPAAPDAPAAPAVPAAPVGSAAPAGSTAPSTSAAAATGAAAVRRVGQGLDRWPAVGSASVDASNRSVPPPATAPPVSPAAAPSVFGRAGTFGSARVPPPYVPGSPAAPPTSVQPVSPSAATVPPVASTGPPAPQPLPQVPSTSRMTTASGGPLPTRIPAPPSPAFGLAAPPVPSGTRAPSNAGSQPNAGPPSTAAPASVQAGPAGLARRPSTASPPSAGPALPSTAAPPAASPPAAPAEPDFEPASNVEASLLDAAEEQNTDSFLSTLLLAKVLVPVRPGAPAGALPGDPGFGWLPDTLDGQTFIVVFTSAERLRDHLGADVETVIVKFVQLIRHWPDEQWSFAVNPSTPIGAKLPGAQIVALANWADEVGLTGDATGELGIEEQPRAAQPRRSAAPAASAGPTMMQKVVPPAQVDYYLERGYDRVSGFVNRAAEAAHLRTPAELFRALGLCYVGSPFTMDASEVYLLRWAAYRPNLYRIPYGGQHEAGMRAMQGWVIERAPFRGNGFAPGDSEDIIAEFKVDSARLPHGAQLWRMSANGGETLVAMLDVDGPLWRRVDIPSAGNGSPQAQA